MDFVNLYAKDYKDVHEHNKKKAHFMSVHKKIQEANSNPDDTASYAHNHMSDWSPEEKKSLLGHNQ